MLKTGSIKVMTVLRRALFAVLLLCGRLTSAGAEWPEVALTPEDRVLILAPHPDDEVIATGGIIQQAVKQHIPVHVVFLTYGDNNEWSFMVYRHHPVLRSTAVLGMGIVRHEEAMAADRVLGLSSNDLTFLGYPDFGTLHIWDSHWRDNPPFRSMLTRVTAVPYPSALHPGRAYKGENILADIEDAIRSFKPTKIFVSHPADQNPDHRALYLFTRVATWDLKPELTCKVFPYLVHFKDWPEVRGLKPSASLTPPEPLSQSVVWRVNPLTREEIETKTKALRQHASQFAASGVYLESFVRQNELFGEFPHEVLTYTALTNLVTLHKRGVVSPTNDQLTEEERAAFVGIETQRVRLLGDRLVEVLTFSRPLGKAVEASVYFFGYRPERPFAEMPKISVNIGELEHKVYDQSKIISADVRVTRTAREIEISVPLSVLGNPDRVLTSARTYLGDIPLDSVSWRVLEISDTVPTKTSNP